MTQKGHIFEEGSHGLESMTQARQLVGGNVRRQSHVQKSSCTKCCIFRTFGDGVPYRLPR